MAHCRTATAHHLGCIYAISGNILATTCDTLSVRLRIGFHQLSIRQRNKTNSREHYNRFIRDSMLRLTSDEVGMPNHSQNLSRTKTLISTPSAPSFQQAARWELQVQAAVWVKPAAKNKLRAI